MATEKRLIDANAVLRRMNKRREDFADGWKTFDAMPDGAKCKYEENLECALMVEDAPTVDAVEVADVREFAKDVMYQFGYYCMNRGRLHITHGGLSTLEHAFDILGWKNPHPVPECECEIEGCHEHATCGTPTADGYKRVCSKHFAKMDGDGNG